MKAQNSAEETALRVTAHLRMQGMNGRVVLPGDTAYESARKVFNAAVASRPALFVFCANARDVQATVRTARAHGLSLSVRGGGHDWAGRALRHEGIVIDLTSMRGVTVDSEARVATIEGSATVADVLAVTTPLGLTAVTAAVASVGMVGFTLGGGYGPLSPKFGLAVDNLIGAELVLANGERVTVNAVENTELFWAIRGGGGHFGVVTSIRVRLHLVDRVSVAAIAFPWTNIRTTLQDYAESVATTPDELTTIPGLGSGPDGALSMMLAAVWCGEPEHAERIFAQLGGLGKSSMVQVAEMSCAEMLALFENNFVEGRSYAVETRSLTFLNAEVIERFTQAIENRTSPYSSLAWHHCHGLPTRIPDGATSFGFRDGHFMVDLVATWDSESRDQEHFHWRWVREFVSGGSANVSTQWISQYVRPECDRPDSICLLD